MFGFFEKTKGEVVDHWYTLIPGFNTSTKDFYAAIEQELKARQVPGLEILHVDFAEGGVLSAQRQYLRLSRERLVFDICAAPFGTAYFFSCRFAELPAVIAIWQLLAVVSVLGICIPVSFLVCAKVFGLLTPFVWPAAWIFLIAVTIYALRNAVALGLKDLDATLIKSHVVGPIYERWFRKETYYRQDTRIMYRDTVNAVVKAKVEEVTGANGVKLVQFNDYSPTFGDLYKPTLVSPSAPTK